MSSRTAALPLALDAAADDERRSARRRFALVVRTLAALSAAMGPDSAPRESRPAPAPLPDIPDAPTRRLNRLRRMFGRLRDRMPPGGKSRPRQR